MPRQTDRRSGFSLIEVLAALAVTAAFVGVVLPFAASLMSHWSKGEEAIEAADGFMQAEARLADDFGEMLPLAEQGQHSHILFRADRTEIRFIRPALAGALSQGLEMVVLRIEHGATGDVLHRRARAFGAAGAAEAGLASDTVLLAGPWRLRFAPLGANGKPTERGQGDVPSYVSLAATPLGAAAPPPLLVLPVIARAPVETGQADANGAPAQ